MEKRWTTKSLIIIVLSSLLIEFIVMATIASLRIIAIYKEFEIPYGSLKELIQEPPYNYRESLVTRIETYRLDHGFYPTESEWHELFDKGLFLPLHGTSSKLSLRSYYISSPYQYKSESIPGNTLIVSKHGTGYSKYELRYVETDDEKTN